MLCLALLGLAACGAPSETGTNEAPANEASINEVAPPPLAIANESADSPMPDAPTIGPLSCAADIGAAAAERRAKVCRNVSPATRPPCNVANSCAMIEDEIARSCALFDGEGEPMPDCQPAPKSGEAAAAVVELYYSALNARDYDTAWQQWGEDGRPGETRDAFEAGFARTRSTEVTIGALEPGEGAAGSIYQTVPVEVDATLDDGQRQRFSGAYVLRRVNDVEGASPAQLRWHITSARLAEATR